MYVPPRRHLGALLMSKRSQSTVRRDQVRFAAIVLVPACLLLFAFRYGAILYLGYLSTQNWQAMAAGQPSFVGLANFSEALLADELFRVAMRNTIHYILLFLGIEIPLSLLIALGIDCLKREWARQAALTAYFMPLVTSMTATAVLFVFLYDPVNGLINRCLIALGLKAISFLKSPATALNSVILMNAWKALGFPTVIFFAGLQTIPREYYDAAAIDGSNAWQRFRYVIWPLLWPTTALLLVTEIVETTRVFTPIYAMTGTGSRQPGGPLNSTLVWSLHVYNQAFRFNRLGYGAALSILMFVLVLLLLAIQLRLTRVKWEY